ncbi:alpha/beta hydrolase family protein [Burkholderiales bacterium JOSHI_001]|nr:alpha/beta hydrolase family protein [Burkholderiales bacterium JOSHI_001]
MLARLQRALVLGVLTLILAWVAWGLVGGWPWPHVLGGALALVFAHAWVLALEFVLLSQVRPGAGIARASAWQLVQAWAGEVINGLRVFGWRQPFRSGLIADHLPATDRQGVLLVHGFVCNRGLWTPWMQRLQAQGVPFVAVNLEPVFGSIDRYVPLIDSAVLKLQQATGRPPLLVAHSMGGLAVRAWLRDHDADARVSGVVTIGTPHHGTWLARWSMTANTRQMRQGSAWLQALAAAEPAQRRARFTCFFGHCDNIVFPAHAATLPGADNRHLPGVAHVHMAFQAEVWSEVSARLGLSPEA